ncbi:hypothetical protein JM79_0354 [Gramella sp. Hel_I_59]|uniref:hypothetical protein n=1 Tax=Gramella sp. Hel_I_59 TaxID=1249978 RepID=UPI001152B71D|nr:hypothetical protein [Gramella sp. Hel_I_59]TQI69474.1 hypothetical protein JM79_0354 [Gramella sp. Hel_I_59]
MKFLKDVFSEYVSTPTFLKFKTKRAFFLPVIALVLILFSSCNPAALVNPDSYSDKWENTYVWFSPSDLSTIYVSGNGDPETALPVPNDSDYLIEWSKKGEVYELKITSYYQDIDFAWFDGYDAENNSEEIPWIQEGNTLELVSEKLLPSENGRYRISLSDDLKD